MSTVPAGSLPSSSVLDAAARRPPPLIPSATPGTTPGPLSPPAQPPKPIGFKLNSVAAGTSVPPPIPTQLNGNTNSTSTVTTPTNGTAASTTAPAASPPLVSTNSTSTTNASTLTSHSSSSPTAGSTPSSTPPSTAPATPSSSSTSTPHPTGPPARPTGPKPIPLRLQQRGSANAGSTQIAPGVIIAPTTTPPPTAAQNGDAASTTANSTTTEKDGIHPNLSINASTTSSGNTTCEPTPTGASIAPPIPVVPPPIPTSLNSPSSANNTTTNATTPSGSPPALPPPLPTTHIQFVAVPPALPSSVTNKENGTAATGASATSPTSGASVPPTPTSAAAAAPAVVVPEEPAVPLTEEEKLAEKAAKHDRMRTKAAFEIELTEITFVEKLETLQALYITPLIQAADSDDPILTPTEIQTLFSNISVIAQLNRKFLTDLSARLKGWNNTDSMIGDVFLQFTPYLKMYTVYCGNHDNATELIRKLDKDSRKFREFIAETLVNTQNKNTTLATYLIEPIQRIPRYKLLIEQLLAHTKPDHPDYTSLQKGFELVQKVAQHVNQEMHASENRNAILKIQSEFTHAVSFVSPSRRYVRQGTLIKKCRNSDKPYQFFLFNDLLAYASTSMLSTTSTTSRYKLHQEIPIDRNFRVSDVPWVPSKDPPKDKDGNSLEEEKFLFQIGSIIKSFIVYVPDQVSKTSWLQSFATILAERDAAEKQRHAQRHDGTGGTVSHTSANKGALPPLPKKDEIVAPVWQNDKDEKACPICRKDFTRLTKRRHHCRKCGGLCCNSCSLKRMIIKSSKSAELRDPQRVCDKCVDEITEQHRAAAEMATRMAREAMGLPPEEPKSTPTKPGGPPPSSASLNGSDVPTLAPQPKVPGLGADLAAALQKRNQSVSTKQLEEQKKAAAAGNNASSPHHASSPSHSNGSGMNGVSGVLSPPSFTTVDESEEVDSDDEDPAGPTIHQSTSPPPFNRAGTVTNLNGGAPGRAPPQLNTGGGPPSLTRSPTTPHSYGTLTGMRPPPTPSGVTVKYPTLTKPPPLSPNGVTPHPPPTQHIADIAVLAVPPPVITTTGTHTSSPSMTSTPTNGGAATPVTRVMGHGSISSEPVTRARGVNVAIAQRPALLVPCCRALYQYIPATPEDLAMAEGEIVRIVSKDISGWWVGEAADGRTGSIPMNYVEECGEREWNAPPLSPTGAHIPPPIPALVTKSNSGGGTSSSTNATTTTSNNIDTPTKTVSTPPSLPSPKGGPPPRPSPESPKGVNGGVTSPTNAASSPSASQTVSSPTSSATSPPATSPPALPSNVTNSFSNVQGRVASRSISSLTLPAPGRAASQSITSNDPPQRAGRTSSISVTGPPPSNTAQQQQHGRAASKSITGSAPPPVPASHMQGRAASVSITSGPPPVPANNGNTGLNTSGNGAPATAVGMPTHSGRAASVSITSSQGPPPKPAGTAAAASSSSSSSSTTSSSTSSSSTTSTPSTTSTTTASSPPSFRPAARSPPSQTLPANVVAAVKACSNFVTNPFKANVCRECKQLKSAHS